MSTANTDSVKNQKDGVTKEPISVSEIFKQYVDLKKENLSKQETGNLHKTGGKNGKFESWQMKFANEHTSDLFELILHTDEIIENTDSVDADTTNTAKDLHTLACYFTAQLATTMSPEEIRKIFGIESGFSKAKEKQLLEESKWCEEY